MVPDGDSDADEIGPDAESPTDGSEALPDGDGDAAIDDADAGVSAVSTWPIATAEALARPASDQTVLSGSTDRPYQDRSPEALHTWDLRDWINTAFPYESLYPFLIGRDRSAAGSVVVGGLFLGQQPSSVSWAGMKADYDGTGIWGGASDWLIIDGTRFDNMMDDVRPRGSAERFVLRNIWSRNTRDDVIENDSVLGGLIHDCLFESAFVFLSEQNGTWSGAYDLEISHTLVRLEPMTYDTDVGGDPPYPGSLVEGRAHAQLFKHFFGGGEDTPLRVHDSVFFVSQLSVNGPAAMNFPEDATWDDVTLLYAGGGTYPGRLPSSGVTEMNLTTHTRGELEAFWDDAVRVWRERHGVRSFEDVDMGRFIHPAPFR